MFLLGDISDIGILFPQPPHLFHFLLLPEKEEGREEKLQYSGIPVSGMDKAYAFYWIDNNPGEKGDSLMYKYKELMGGGGDQIFHWKVK